LSGFATLDKRTPVGKAWRMSNLAHIRTLFKVCPIAGS